MVSVSGAPRFDDEIVAVIEAATPELWLLALVVQVYTMYRSARGKMRSSDTVENADEATGLLA